LDLDPLVRGTDPRIQIRIHTKMSRIPNTGRMTHYELLHAVTTDDLDNAKNMGESSSSTVDIRYTVYLYGPECYIMHLTDRCRFLNYSVRTGGGGGGCVYLFNKGPVGGGTNWV
jgi:hypothetical protein